MEKKTMEITIPEGKKPKMTEGTDKCVIEWVDETKTFNEYVKEFSGRLEQFGVSATPNPYNWVRMFKFGLLQFIADDLNEEKIDWDDSNQIKYCVYYYRPCHALKTDWAVECQMPNYIFTKLGAEKAIQLIPQEFFRTF